MSDDLSIPASAEDALTLFRAWKDDGAVIRIEFRFLALAACFRAKVSKVLDDKLFFMADDLRSELVLPLKSGMSFRFLDLRNYPHGEDFERMLMLFYPFQTDPDEANQIAFAEEVHRETQP